MARARIGTSGWHYAHWRGPFYPPELAPREWLRFYAGRLAAVEVNASFYGPLEPDTVREWLSQVPPAFEFAVKAPRYITHMRKLRHCEESLARFLEQARAFGDQLGPVLFQLPPRWHCDLERLRDFLALLPAGLRTSFEFRDPDWHREEVYACLRDHQAAFCVFDLAGSESPAPVTAEFVYVRLHGPREAYGGRYSTAALRRWHTRIGAWLRKGLDVYVFFDNDEAGYAVKNALALERYQADTPARTRLRGRTGGNRV